MVDAGSYHLGKMSIDELFSLRTGSGEMDNVSFVATGVGDNQSIRETYHLNGVTALVEVALGGNATLRLYGLRSKIAENLPLAKKLVGGRELTFSGGTF